MVTAQQRLKEELAAWLDATLLSEEAPQGIAQEFIESVQASSDLAAQTKLGPERRADDQYQVWAALTALTQETRLQGRAFQRVHEALAPLTQQIDAEHKKLATLEQASLALHEAVERERNQVDKQVQEQVKKAEAQLRRELLAPLLDVYESLQRGYQLANAQHATMQTPKRWWPWRGKAKLQRTVDALAQGYRLGFERLQAAFVQLDVSEMNCTGALFDPTTMTAVAVETTSDEDEGTVLEVIRPGFFWRNDLLRSADVKVASKRREESAT